MPDVFDLSAAESVVEAHGRDPNRLVAILFDLQERYGHLTRQVVEEAARLLDVPPSRALHVATFYKSLGLEPRGRTVVKVCKGTACHVRGASVIEDELARRLAVEPGGTTEDLSVTLEAVACVGACAMAPVVVAGEEYVGQASPSKVRRLVSRLQQRAEAGEDRVETAPAPSAPAWSGPRFTTLGALEARRKEVKAARSKLVRRVLVCSGPGCVVLGALEVRDRLAEAAAEAGIEVEVELEACASRDDPVHLSATGCQGLCQEGVLVRVLPDDILYTKVKPADVPDIVESTLKQGAEVERLLHVHPETGERCRSRDEVPFYSRQNPVALAGCGSIDPESLDDALAMGAFAAYAKASAMAPESIVGEVDSSGLRGRGGGGFPTGKKWRACVRSKGSPRTLVCNGDEGDPGAFMDRAIMEGDPFRVIEGLLIGARAVSAPRAYVYVRDEYPLAVQRMTHAVEVCRAAGILGDDLLGTGASFDIDVVRGGGAFVCGEETALLHSLEGRAGEPRQRPPYPAERGFEGGPTLINNVESWATVPAIIGKGSGWFAHMGTEGSTGTKVFSLVGKVRSTGLVEVPMGTTLRQLVDEVGGGVPDGRQLKAVQTGGPSGGCIPASLADTPVDFDALKGLGSMMGSGGLIVMDDRTCMVDVARYFTEFLASESCGRCMPCREGLGHLRDILGRICAGEGTEADVDLLEDVADTVGDTALCGLGQTAANPVRSTLRHFRQEYLAHVRDKRCPAGVCRALVTFRITEDCTGCGICRKLCPAEAIAGEKKALHVIDAELCTKCGVCLAACKDAAVVAE